MVGTRQSSTETPKQNGLNQVKADLRQATDEAESYGKQKLNQFMWYLDRERLQNLARNTGKDLRQYWSKKSRQFSNIYRKSEENIRAHPLGYVGAALVMGMILGKFLRRK